MTDPRIAIAKDLAKIKGMENSPWVLMKWSDKLRVVRRFEAKESVCFNEDYIGPYLRLDSEDGKWSSASIREGLGLEIIFTELETHTPFKSFSWVLQYTKVGAKFATFLEPSNPTADDQAMQLGIIEYHKQFPKEIESYLKEK